jgi:hypothetical protein
MRSSVSRQPTSRATLELRYPLVNSFAGYLWLEVWWVRRGLEPGSYPVPRIFLRCTDSRPEEVQIRPPRLFRPEFPHFNWSTHRPVTTPPLTRGLWDLRRAGHPAQQPPENRCEHKHDEQTSAAADDERRPGRGQIE